MKDRKGMTLSELKKLTPNAKYKDAMDVFKKLNREDYRQFNVAGEAQEQLKKDWKALSKQQKEKYQKIFEEADEKFQQEVEEVNEEVPPKPKQPLAPHFRYYDTVREEVKREHPGISGQDLVKILSDMWGKLSEKDRQPFQEAAKQEREPFKKAMMEWNDKYLKQVQKLGNDKKKKEKPKGIPYEKILESKQQRELVSLNDPPKKRGRPGKQEQKEQETEEQPVQEKGQKKKEKSQKQKEEQKEKSPLQKKAQKQEDQKEKSPVQKKEAPAKRGRSKE